MIVQKNARVVKCVVTNEWQNPSGGITYYHELTLDNLDIGTVGKMQKYPKELSEGAMLVYTIDEKNKIKIINSSMESGKMDKKFTKTTGNTAKKHEDFMGFAWSYAKDLIIAGKDMRDVNELNEVARYIYTEIGKMLKNQ